ncbi:flagellar assembly protein T N-terminal domain-containing protein [Chromatiaceae bacterium AAb-1]|nr:flagellar assembly protein T N-terminal domain-containing protein [Chromatiaceae bacterium AAb-1]
MKKYIALCLLGFLSYSQTCKAAWYEATGQATIEQGNVEKARQAAIDDALKRAALFAGASFSSSQQIANGIMQTDTFILDSHAEIKQVQLLSESHSGNMITVSLRADIIPQHSSCQLNNFRKNLLLPPIQLNARQDAIYGQLFELGKDLTTQLEYHLRDYSPTVIAARTELSPERSQLVYPLTDQLFSNGSHYLLSATINDLSLGEKTNHFWQKSSKQRYFSIDVLIFDLLEQQPVFQQEYRTSGSWPYKAKDTPQSHSQAFWQMEYGSNINVVLKAIADDVQQQLQCAPLFSQIKQVRQNQIMLNIGHLQGLKTGDKLEVIQLQRHPGRSDIKRWRTSPLTLTVTELTAQSAWAGSSEQQLLTHIQQGDLIAIRRKAL